MARTACRGVCRVRVDETGGLAAHGEARGVEGALEVVRAVGAKVDGAVRDGAAHVVGDAHGQVVPVDERDVVVVEALAVAERPLRDGGGGHTGTRVAVALEAAIAAAVEARVRARVAGEVAVATSLRTL